MSSYSHADPIALSFNDTCLRMSDVQLLQGPHWLNDQILSFYYEYLEKVKYKNNPDLLFVAPEVTQCMKLTDDDELETVLNQLEAPRKQFIFFALNDNESTQAGGTHWSLLVFSRPEKTFFHFDSWGNNNSLASQQFVHQIKVALNCRQCHIKPIRCLQQANGYDCGIHVICMTDNIADYVNRYECVEGVGPLHQDIISAKRSELLKLIQSLGGKV
ncbi:sentrin-specific protease 8 [Zeugodacus cucurbitae]|uniref:Sentrin-specific protease 8 n=1 Tax=Zeugodacus cucurbitae TaxID=28588 RepID=A0A0A1XB95_ZEUCU|nr:sentrin-specific protease 8 [Zeugodacus cucurbitae]XP_054089514.1 sentrin-specific protease 8 [Zeugodacus cucurbitae]